MCALPAWGPAPPPRPGIWHRAGSPSCAQWEGLRPSESSRGGTSPSRPCLGPPGVAAVLAARWLAGVLLAQLPGESRTVRTGLRDPRQHTHLCFHPRGSTASSGVFFAPGTAPLASEDAVRSAVPSLPSGSLRQGGRQTNLPL